MVRIIVTRTNLDHQEVLLDLSVVREAAHGVDGLVSEVVLSAGVVFNQLENNNFILLL